MEKHWVKREGGGKLIVFVLGWAADYRIIEHVIPDGYDALAVYDYRRIEPLETGEMKMVDDYSERFLIAWSFGVWASEQIFSGIKFKKNIAFNGTPYPVNSEYGIDPRRLGTTIRGLQAGGMEGFNRRAYGEFYGRFEKVLSPRSLEANIEELSALRSMASETYTPGIEWDKAVIGSHDEIFPPENMIAYWGNRGQVLPLPHYPFADAGIITRIIDNR